MTGIFISYRREDSAPWAGRVYERLAHSFRREQIFMDVDNIAPGLDFVEELAKQVGKCDALVAIIGKNWVDARNEKGERRLDDPDDFVRIELEAALQRDVRVIPVLVGGATMPAVADLPTPLQRLARRHAIELTHARFGSDVQPLESALRSVLDATTGQVNATTDVGPASPSIDVGPASPSIDVGPTSPSIQLVVPTNSLPISSESEPRVVAHSEPDHPATVAGQKRVRLIMAAVGTVVAAVAAYLVLSDLMRPGLAPGERKQEMRPGLAPGEREQASLVTLSSDLVLAGGQSSARHSVYSKVAPYTLSILTRCEGCQDRVIVYCRDPVDAAGIPNQLKSRRIGVEITDLSNWAGELGGLKLHPIKGASVVASDIRNYSLDCAAALP